MPTAEQRIDNFIVRMPNDCWIWTGPRRGLYGSTSIDGRATLVHRFQYERYVAPIPDGLQIDHLCREELCCNPRHLEPVTPQENTLRSPFSRGSINGRKTHCPQGHPYDVANTYGNINSGRLCRPCNLARVARKRVAGSEQVSA